MTERPRHYLSERFPMLVRSSRAALRRFLVDAGSLAGGDAVLACIACRLYVQLLHRVGGVQRCAPFW